jgi:hypothetical protein
MKLMQARGADAGAPRLTCTRRVCAVPGNSDVLSWLSVREVQYGPSKNDLRNQQPIEVSEDAVIAR